MSSPKEKVANSSMVSKDATIILAQQLKLQFHSTKKGDLETMEYVRKLKSTADSLAAIGDPISDPDLVYRLLAGLPSPQYLVFKNRILSQSPLRNFSEACSMLYEYEKSSSTSTPGVANLGSAAENNSNNSNSNSGKSTVEMIHDIAGTVSTVASIAREFWNVLGPSSGGPSSGTSSKPKSKPKPKPKLSTPGNNNNGRTGGRGNNNRGRGGGPSTRNSGKK